MWKEFCIVFTFYTVSFGWHFAQPPSWRTTYCRLSATVCAIYSQLSFIRGTLTLNLHAGIRRCGCNGTYWSWIEIPFTCKWRSLANAVMNLRMLKIAENISAAWSYWVCDNGEGEGLWVRMVGIISAAWSFWVCDNCESEGLWVRMVGLQVSTYLIIRIFLMTDYSTGLLYFVSSYFITRTVCKVQGSCS